MVQHSALTGAELHAPGAHKTQHEDGGADELALAASQIVAGTLATARLGSGTADGDHFLRGDQTWAVPDPPDPLTTLHLIDHFLSGNATSGQIGTLGWTFTGGTTVVTGLTAAVGKPGYVRRTTSASSGTVARTALRLGDTTGVSMVPADVFDLTYRFRLNTNDGDTMVLMGLSSDWAASPSPASGIYVQKKLADTQWFGTCRASNVESRTAALATVDTGWHTVRMRRIDASTIGFSIDGGVELTLATNVPTVDVQPGWAIVNGAAADKTIDMDLVVLSMTGLG